MLGQIKLALFFIMILGAGGGLWYVQHLKSENEILTLNNAKLEESVEGQKAVIQQQLQDIEQIQSISIKRYFDLEPDQILKITH